MEFREWKVSLGRLERSRPAPAHLLESRSGFLRQEFNLAILEGYPLGDLENLEGHRATRSSDWEERNLVDLRATPQNRFLPLSFPECLSEDLMCLLGDPLDPWALLDS